MDSQGLDLSLDGTSAAPVGSGLCLRADSWQEGRVVWVLRPGLLLRSGKELSNQGGLDTEHVYEGWHALVAGRKLELRQPFSPLLERAVSSHERFPTHIGAAPRW